MMCSSQGNQKSLSFKIQNSVGLDALIVCNHKVNYLNSPFKLFLRLWGKISSLLTFLIFRRVWFGMINYYDNSYKDFSIPPNLSVCDINDPEVTDFISNFKPDLVVVSGTNLLKDNLIDEIHKFGKVMNLHTGISPYVKGGPNCTNWCLFLKEFYLIGNTVMWLDKGIDSGNIITTQRTPLIGNETLLELHIKVMNHAHLIYVSTIKSFVDGNTLPNISQNQFDMKRLFLSKHWGFYQMFFALFNFYCFYREGSIYFKNTGNINLIELN